MGMPGVAITTNASTPVRFERSNQIPFLSLVTCGLNLFVRFDFRPPSDLLLRALSFRSMFPQLSDSYASPGIRFQCICIIYFAPTQTVSSPPAPAPAPVYGTDWNVTVQNPHTVGNAGEDQHTVYEFMLRTNLPEYGHQQYHVRKRRYSEARAFFKALSVQFDTSRFPVFPEKNFWGRCVPV